MTSRAQALFTLDPDTAGRLAICLFDSPFATSRRTAHSRGVHPRQVRTGHECGGQCGVLQQEPGGPNHNAREFFATKHRLFRYLVEHRGFTTFSLEVSWDIGLQLDDYVRHGTGDPRTILRQDPTWNTREYLDLVEWMREHNQSRPDTVRFMGNDILYPGLTGRTVELLGAYFQDTTRRTWRGSPTSPTGCVPRGPGAAQGGRLDGAARDGPRADHRHAGVRHRGCRAAPREGGTGDALPGRGDGRQHGVVAALDRPTTSAPSTPGPWERSDIALGRSFDAIIHFHQVEAADRLP